MGFAETTEGVRLLSGWAGRGAGGEQSTRTPPVVRGSTCSPPLGEKVKIRLSAGR